MAVLSFIISLKLTMYDFKKIMVSPVVELFRVSVLYRVVVHVEDMGAGSCDVHMTSYQRSLVYVSVHHQFLNLISSSMFLRVCGYCWGFTVRNHGKEWAVREGKGGGGHRALKMGYMDPISKSIGFSGNNHMFIIS